MQNSRTAPRNPVFAEKPSSEDTASCKPLTIATCRPKSKAPRLAMATATRTGAREAFELSDEPYDAELVALVVTSLFERQCALLRARALCDEISLLTS